MDNMNVYIYIFILSIYIHIPYNTPHISDIHTQKSHAGRRNQRLPLVRLPFVRLHPPQLRDDLSSRKLLGGWGKNPSEKYGPSSGMRTETQLINGKMPNSWQPNHQPGKVWFLDGPLTISPDCAEVVRVAQLMKSP